MANGFDIPSTFPSGTTFTSRDVPKDNEPSNKSNSFSEINSDFQSIGEGFADFFEDISILPNAIEAIMDNVHTQEDVNEAVRSGATPIYSFYDHPLERGNLIGATFGDGRVVSNSFETAFGPEMRDAYRDALKYDIYSGRGDPGGTDNNEFDQMMDYVASNPSAVQDISGSLSYRLPDKTFSPQFATFKGSVQDDDTSLEDIVSPLNMDTRFGTTRLQPLETNYNFVPGSTLGVGEGSISQDDLVGFLDNIPTYGTSSFDSSFNDAIQQLMADTQINSDREPGTGIFGGPSFGVVPANPISTQGDSNVIFGGDETL